MGSVPADSDGDAALLSDLRRQAAGAARLTDGEEASLLSRSARGDRSSQDKLVAANLGMVIRLAEQRGDKGLSVPDLVQEGSLGLVEAVHAFAGSGECDFATFAEKKVGAQMDAAIEAEAAAVREAEQLVTAATDYERTELSLRRTLGRAATEKEIAQKLEWTVDRTRYIAQVVADARRRHDEELLEYIDPDADPIDIDGAVGDE
jgi:RNA polymerase primary sigma factor